MIVVRRHHALGLAEARNLAEDIARRLQQEHGGDYRWEGRDLVFETKDTFEVRVELGFLLRPLSSLIEREIRRFCDEHLGPDTPADGRRPAASRRRTVHLVSGRSTLSTSPWRPDRGASRSAATEPYVPVVRVLVADDEAPIRERLCHFLTREGYLVAAVETGRDALDAVLSFRPDVIVVDMIMPAPSGADVLIALRQMRISIR